MAQTMAERLIEQGIELGKAQVLELGKTQVLKQVLELGER